MTSLDIIYVISFFFSFVFYVIYRNKFTFTKELLEISEYEYFYLILIPIMTFIPILNTLMILTLLEQTIIN